ncbi:probable RNA methyltransferase bin3 isoform X4 [Agrilus planipennis]|uniref:RNA methyltransferase n=1 Tax=Agrilus planipennis TaxID=224129 RepID=A0A1W4WEG1_AGRPL|nr:probable RNA methyltransferase bin3 isoform X3 [Agrilus planipennis]XP_025832640.1 probable RNA methyltransferase bin3 isoform X4 [Agrilus planipennis]
MSSQVQAQTFEHNSNQKSFKNHRKDTDTSKKKQKNVKSGRKRLKSFSSNSNINKLKSMRPVLPTRFLLGGNINDPLNLNSLQDEEVNRAMNAVTPKSSPIPTPPRRKAQIEVIIPPNINDPLNLINCENDDEYEQQLCSPLKKGRKKRTRKKRTTSGTSEVADADTSGCSEAKTPESNQDSAKIPEECSDSKVEQKSVNLELQLTKKDNKCKRKSEDHKDNVKKTKYNAMDKIVSPVVPQPGSWLKRSNSRISNLTRNMQHRGQNNKDVKLPQFKGKDRAFQYGNYNRYYGYRNQHSEVDLRLKCFMYHHDLFEGKDILDIGCNIGHITLSVARDLKSKSVIGIDIDKKLIEIARKNVKHYVKSSQTPPDDGKESGEGYSKSSFTKEEKGYGFPNNVTFKHGNYVLDDDSLLSLEQPQFDIILCLSITKWIHLNWGDSGLKQAFRRMYAQLRPGGKLILEPQNWASYKSKKKLTETIYNNYNSIQFFPENFTQYLLSPEVGFAKSEILGFPQHQARGFQRPIQMFTKSTMFPSERSDGSMSCHYSSTKLYTNIRSVESNNLTPKSNIADFEKPENSSSPFVYDTSSAIEGDEKIKISIEVNKCDINLRVLDET